MDNKYEILTQYISEFDDAQYGDWIIDKENDGSSEHPMHVPYVNYSDVVMGFMNDLYSFYEDNKDMELYNYQEIMDKNGVGWDSEEKMKVDVSLLDGQCIMALIFGAVRADRFCEGVLLELLEDGSILKWLKRLKSIDESKEEE